MRFTPTSPNYNALINGFCKIYSTKEAVDLLDEMADKGVDPNVITYTTVLNEFADLGDIGLSFAMLSKMFVSGCSPNIPSFTWLIKGISLRGQMVRSSLRAGWYVQRGIFKRIGSDTAFMPAGIDKQFDEPSQ
uniref:Pentatricopeptide repeat-containing protein At3g48810-like isoform X1 n=1 Tax=Nicotiana sylvestris TaxID=4096 RepID=A0A1U7X376_NICSY|nr:PREDICTED: pentatricopeptide repeat-containing protein At3g48810-like isoform X1 [Nicotiana sylvestris]